MPNAMSSTNITVLRIAELLERRLVFFNHLLGGWFRDIVLGVMRDPVSHLMRIPDVLEMLKIARFDLLEAFPERFPFISGARQNIVKERICLENRDLPLGRRVRLEMFFNLLPSNRSHLRLLRFLAAKVHHVHRA